MRHCLPSLHCAACIANRSRKQQRASSQPSLLTKLPHCRFWRFYTRFQLHRPIVERSWLCFLVMFCILTVLVLGLLAACVWLHLFQKQHKHMRWEW